MLLELEWNPILCSPDTAGLGLMETPKKWKGGKWKMHHNFQWNFGYSIQAKTLANQLCDPARIF